VRGAHQFRRAAEARSGARRRHDTHRLATPHQRTGKGLHAGTRFDRLRLAREHRMIEQHVAGREAHVGGNHAA
jgi:hypothetical protein